MMPARLAAAAFPAAPGVTEPPLIVPAPEPAPVAAAADEPDAIISSEDEEGDEAEEGEEGDPESPDARPERNPCWPCHAKDVG